MSGDLALSEMAEIAGACPQYRSGFSVGGVSVEVAGDCAADVTLVPALEPFRVNSRHSDITIQVQRLAKCLSVPGRQLFDSGAVWKLYEHGDGFQFDFRAPAFGEMPYKRLFVDRRFREATLQMSEACITPEYVTGPLEYPLDELLIMHRLTQERAIELHGCGIVGADGAGNLFVGHSGAGKSTTTRLWTACEDVTVLSDDRIILRRDEEIRMYGTPWHGEAAYALPGSAPLKRIFVLEHGHGNALTRLTQNQAVAELFARSFVPFHRHEYLESALSFLEEIAEAIPCYRYAFEPDSRAVETIQQLLD